MAAQDLISGWRGPLLVAISLSVCASATRTAVADALPVTAHSAPVAPQRVYSVEAVQPATPCVGAPGAHPLGPATRGEAGVARAALFPQLQWPLAISLDDDLVLVEYADLDLSTPGFIDHEGHAHTQDGHRGTDYAAFSFRQMDRGVPVLAAAPGVVAQVVYDKFDRNVLGPFPDQGNNVILRHADNTFAWYWHLRKNSTTVELGDSVQAGEMIGLVGSSGYSFQAHLHFELGHFVAGNWIFRDPYEGANQLQPSLWLAQEPYIGVDPVHIFDVDISTELAVGGNIGVITSPQLMQRLTAPAVMGVDEPFLLVWTLIQGQAGDAFDVNLYRPDGSLFGKRIYTMPSKSLWTWVNFVWSWGSLFPSPPAGTWRIDVTRGGQLQKQRFFEVAATTAYRPRFWPVAGRSLRVEGGELRDTLRLDSLSGPAIFSLVDAPGYVSLLDDSIVVVAAGAVPATRSVHFQVLASDAAGRRDTMWYHLVDMNRPISCAVGQTGDVNATGELTSADIIAMVNFVFKGGSNPQPCEAAADVNCSGSINSSDIIALVNFIFKGGSVPCDVCSLIPESWGCP